MATDFNGFFKNGLGKFFGLPKQKSVDQIINFVGIHLPQFSIEQKGDTLKNENGLTQKLIKLLNTRKSNLPFYFHPEYMENEKRGDSSRSDFSVITFNRIRIITFEAKRLDNLNKARRKEYLIGRDGKKKFENSGGVERFKNGTHGIGLSHSAIVGYVQVENFSFWEKSINSWVEELAIQSPVRNLIWTHEDKLRNVSDDMGTHCFFKSDCARENDKITLHHLWVNLVPHP